MTEGYKLIFIDVDGVLHSTTAREEDHFDAQIMESLARLFRQTGATPVLSTAWRLKEESREAVRAQFLQYGLPMPLGCTPRIHGPRGNEVLAWLQMNTRNVLHDRVLRYGEMVEEDGEFGPAQYQLPTRILCTQFVVIDDRNFRSIVHGGKHRHLLTDAHFIHTDASTGMQPEDAEMARQILCDAVQQCHHCQESALHCATCPPLAGDKVFCGGACLSAYMATTQ